MDDIFGFGLPSDLAPDESDSDVAFGLPSDIGRKTKRVRKGFVRGSTAHVSVMVSGRKNAVERRKREASERQGHALKRGWDAIVLRTGDTAASSNHTQTERPHANTYTASGLLQVAWKDRSGHSTHRYSYLRKGVGQRERIRQMDVRDSSKPLTVSTTVAALSHQHQAHAMSDFCAQNFPLSYAIRIRRGSDSTPWALQFGELTNELRESARYFVRRTITRIDGSEDEIFLYH